MIRRPRQLEHPCSPCGRIVVISLICQCGTACFGRVMRHSYKARIWATGAGSRLGGPEAPGHASAKSIPSFTAFRSFCLQPRYRSVVWTET